MSDEVEPRSKFAALIKEAQAGDRVSYSRLIQIFYPSFVHVVYGKFRNEETARLVIDDFIRSFEIAVRKHRYRNPIHFKQFLMAVLKSTMARHKSDLETGELSSRIPSSFEINFDSSLSAEQITKTLSALADFYRACGGIGFEVEPEGIEMSVPETVSV